MYTRKDQYNFSILNIGRGLTIVIYSENVKKFTEKCRYSNLISHQLILLVSCKVQFRNEN